MYRGSENGKVRYRMCASVSLFVIRNSSNSVDSLHDSFLTPTHIVGPGELVEDITGVVPNERSAFALGSSHAANQGMQTNNLPSQDMLDTSLTRVRMGRYDPLSTFSVMLQENDFFQRDQYAFFQCTVRFVDRDGKTLVTRVSTHRLSIAKDIGEYLDSIDDEVIPVLLGKEAVYRSMFGREMNEDIEVDAPNSTQLENLAYDAQSDLDATISRISGAFRLLGLEKGSRGYVASVLSVLHRAYASHNFFIQLGSHRRGWSQSCWIFL